jgi:dienelactone hydrolase
MTSRRALLPLAVLAISTVVLAQGSATPFGAACPTPTLRAFGFAPNPGAGHLALHETGLVAGATPVATFGVSRSLWGPIPLPIDLGPSGLPGCSVLCDWTIPIVAPTFAGGVAEVFVPVPANGSLTGARLFAQWANLSDPRVHPTIAVTTSNGVEFTLGAVVGMPGFTVTGDPTAPNGARWTYQSTDGGVVYDLTGVLFVPPGPPLGGRAHHPAVILSHGSGGSANGYSSGIARTMVGWGLVCIAANLTHAGNAPIGSPGLATERGASHANALRIRKCRDLLQALGNVDLRRVAVHGNSMGAFATGAVIGTFPGDFLVASQTSGGMSDQPGSFATTRAQAQAIRIPFQLHHGDADTVVPLALAQSLAGVLAANPTVHELRVYPGFTHAQMSTDAGMLAAVRAWYVAHGLL